MAQLLQPVRPLSLVPKWLWVGLLISLVIHNFATRGTTDYQPTQTKLPTPQNQVIKAATMGDPYFLASVGLLWLQYFDDQPGLTLSYHDLNYHTLATWLNTYAKLAPELQYPQFMASRLYASVSDDEKVRVMLDYVHAAFLDDPNRWRWLAESAVIARHRLKDLPLALRYAQDLTTHSPADAPYWVKDMQIILLEAMNEYDAALLLTGALLDSGAIKDEKEINFLTQKLEELKTKSADKPGQSQ